jgi:hypothetical protein
MKRFLLLLALPVLALTAAPAAQAHPQKACFAEVWYLDQTRGHTYEYRCGPFRLHAGQLVRVPRNNYGTLEMATARIIRISSYRTYFGPLKTVAGIR